MPTMQQNASGPKLPTHNEGAYRLQRSSGKTLDCGVLGLRIKAALCLSQQPLQYTALGTGCAPLLSLQPSTGR